MLVLYSWSCEWLLTFNPGIPQKATGEEFTENPPDKCCPLWWNWGLPCRHRSNRSQADLVYPPPAARWRVERPANATNSSDVVLYNTVAEDQQLLQLVAHVQSTTAGMGTLARRQYFASLIGVMAPDEMVPVRNPVSIPRKGRGGGRGGKSQRRIPSQHETLNLQHRKEDRKRKAAVSCPPAAIPGLV